VQQIQVDLADDRFDITYDPDRVTVADFLRTIRALDYEPKVADRPSKQTVVQERIDPASLPGNSRAWFTEAKTKNKILLVEFSGPD
jgi:hypothetical protein